MSYSIGPLEQERARYFDEWKATADRVLSDPAVQAQLGALGGRLLQINQGTFLPNVRDGLVSVPESYQDTDRIALLPVLPADPVLRQDKTMASPTPGRREKMRDALSQGSWGQRRISRSDRALDSLIAERMAIATSENPELLDIDLSERLAANEIISYKIPYSLAPMTSRPLIVAKTSFMDRLSPAVKGSVIAHEDVHALDSTDRNEKGGWPGVALSELRAYRVGAVITQRAVETGELTAAEVAGQAESNVTIDSLRIEYGIDAERLLNGAPPTITLEQLGEVLDLAIF